MFLNHPRTEFLDACRGCEIRSETKSRQTPHGPLPEVASALIERVDRPSMTHLARDISGQYLHL